MSAEFPQPVHWGLNLAQWQALAEAQRLNLVQLRMANEELKAEIKRMTLQIERSEQLIAELRKAAE